jgi:Icc-related predicted phosphoesterase
MKIVCISDTHNKHHHFTEKINAIEDIDIIIHAGDVSSRGYRWEIEDFLKWFSKLNARYRVFTGGNHDFFMEDSPKQMEEMLLSYSEVTYLEESEVVIDGIKIFGSPTTPFFHNWAFNVHRGQPIREYWLKIPLDTDVLITHGPPKGILDYVAREGKGVGCADLLDVIQSQLNLKLFVCGHIHQSSGMKVIGETTFVNASVLSEQYEPVNDPIVLHI